MKIKDFTRPFNETGRRFAHVLFVVFAAFIVWGFIDSFVQEKAVAWNLTPQPETFTELYLVDYPLSDRAPSVGETVSFSFAIVNHEGGVYRYNIETYIDSPEREKQKVGFVSTLMADGEQHTFSESLIYEQAYASSTVYVHLPDLDQTIHFKIISQ